MSTLALLMGALCIFALAYRYYSAFLAAKVLTLNDSRSTPAHVYEDGHNYVPSPKSVSYTHLVKMPWRMRFVGTVAVETVGARFLIPS